jgi:hypothetical protein
MHCTKLETVYAGAHASRWPTDGFASADVVATCRLLLTRLSLLDGSGAANDTSAPLALRTLLPEETVEFFLQQFGAALAVGARRAHSGDVVVPKIAAVPEEGYVSQVC